MTSIPPFVQSSLLNSAATLVKLSTIDFEQTLADACEIVKQLLDIDGGVLSI